MKDAKALKNDLQNLKTQNKHIFELNSELANKLHEVWDEIRRLKIES